MLLVEKKIIAGQWFAFLYRDRARKQNATRVTRKSYFHQGFQM
jgi:hypothetical protein